MHFELRSASIDIGLLGIDPGPPVPLLPQVTTTSVSERGAIAVHIAQARSAASAGTRDRKIFSNFQGRFFEDEL